ncbi:MAG: hypothetical protein HOE48_21275 [Candidatus Latescibacteria bacterium]|jgi:hypothetical protein|nr:hypothetical protein [Candidatus Latescibacterota bacterium]MBT5831402.1 hypothetical protein [Candidatus Latescibacterota bacterium]
MSIQIDTPMAPPQWALLERQLLKSQSDACAAFFDHYFDERGYLLCVPRWGGDDGPDDGAENVLNWTMLHALGGDDSVLELYKRGWEGHLRQYTEAKTTVVPMAREGMYYKEFTVMFDWFHNGEGLSAFNLQGLSDPHDQSMQVRARRYAGFYMNEDPQAPNYDPEHKIIRSCFNGSRGPLLRKATGLDWAGDPIEIEGRFRLGHGERSYEEMVDHFKDYTDVVGDNPMNLASTILALNAYMLNHEDKYKAWALEYIDAWCDRTAENGGIIPTNIGLDGTIGGECGGRWYGGIYGWGFTVTVPQSGELAHRTYSHRRAINGFGVGLLFTGDQKYVDTWRGVIDHINSNAREIDGETKWPNAYGDYFGEEDWYDWQDKPFDSGAKEVWYWSMKPEDAKRIATDPWVRYLEGDNPDYPVTALQSSLGRVRNDMERMANDTCSPDTRLSDDMNGINPAKIDTLNQLMLGGLPTGRVGSPLYCHVRYFDPEKRRAGIPEDVAALVENISDDEVTLTLVNVNPVDARTVIVQGGAYAEHEIVKAYLDDQVMEVSDSKCSVRLAPGCGAQLKLSLKRFANQPVLEFPW